MSESTPTPAFKASHASRMVTLSLHAFTQLVRMKVFYFLAVFAVIVIGSNFFDMAQHQGPESVGANVLRNIESWSLGAMALFAVVISIVATALLLPRDIEDRTLYTVLAKPVPRIDYLVGRLMGVLLLVFVSLAVMDLLMVAALHLRTGMVMEMQEKMAVGRGWPEEAIQSLKQETLASGVNWQLQAAVLAIFLKVAVMAAICLSVSTFSTSTLFTTVVSFLIFFIGHFQADALDFYLKGVEAGTSTFSQYLALGFSLFIPNFQLFNVVDGLVQNQPITLLMVGKLVMMACYYVLLYTLLAWWIFSDKEV